MSKPGAHLPKRRGTAGSKRAGDVGKRRAVSQNHAHSAGEGLGRSKVRRACLEIRPYYRSKGDRTMGRDEIPFPSKVNCFSFWKQKTMHRTYLYSVNDIGVICVTILRVQTCARRFGTSVVDLELDHP